MRGRRRGIVTAWRSRLGHATRVAGCRMVAESFWRPPRTRTRLSQPFRPFPVPEMCLDAGDDAVTHRRYLAMIARKNHDLRRCVLRRLRSRSSRSPDASVARRLLTRLLDASEVLKTCHTTRRFAHALRCVAAACRVTESRVVASLGLGAHCGPYQVLWDLLWPGSMMVVGTQRTAVRGTVTSATTLVAVAKYFSKYRGGLLST